MRRSVGSGAAILWILGASAALARPAIGPKDAEAIVEVVRGAPQQGLPAIDAPDPADPGALARAAILYALDEHGLLRDPRSIDPNLALRAPFDADAAFAAAAARRDIAAWLASQTRSDPGYLALVAARERYAQIVEAGGWPELAGGADLGPGARDQRVPQLRARLAAEGFAVGDEPPPQADMLDSALDAALADFQAHHGLPSSGVLDAATLGALNAPAETRLATIDANLERDRWLPVALPPTLILVDLAQPSVRLFTDGRLTLEMRAVAGEASRPTPIFASRVTGVEFNPPWNVPSDIAVRELWPRQKRDSSYFRAHDFVVDHGRLIQRAGPMSSLGYVKFDLSDRFEVYLHDTPERADFDRPSRYASHGCVRLERPRDLAAALLGWTPDQVDAAVDAKTTHTVPLKTPIPVILVYRTAEADAGGEVTFRPDVYGWDAEIGAALAGQPLAATRQTTDGAP